MKKQFLFFFLGVILVAVATVSYSFTVTSDSSEAVELIDEAEPPCCPNGPWTEAKVTGNDLPYDPRGYERFDQNGDGIICYFQIRPIMFMDNIGPGNSYPLEPTSGGD